ncbi:hypothetical protein IJG91_00340 [Candidatus Saccharibacteria bacterium]|nr:hypothetical protein [Candidatus Saccharibacteria bacterium]
MDNQPYQPFQPTGQMNPQGGQQQFGNVAGSPAGNFGPNGTMGPTGPAPTARLVPVAAKTQKQNANLIWIILLIIASLVAVTFIGLFIWMFSKWDTAQNDVDSQINAAVATAVNEKAEEMENQFIEREKQPYQIFAGPADYGELSFEYPKTWSVYEAKDANNGGDYEAYLNPGKVYPVGVDTINALRVIIKDQAYDSYVKTYENYVKNGKLAVSVRLINGENANLYTGELPGTKLQGIAAVFKMRDKTAVMQTDAMIFNDDYQRILDTVSFAK